VVEGGPEPVLFEGVAPENVDRVHLHAVNQTEDALQGRGGVVAVAEGVGHEDETVVPDGRQSRGGLLQGGEVQFVEPGLVREADHVVAFLQR